MDLRDRTVVVTGASSGIGTETVRAIAGRGARVIATARREDRLEALADEIRHLLEEGVVPEAADVDTCLLLGAGFPFFLGGITKHLDATGISERVVGRTFARARSHTPFLGG